MKRFEVIVSDICLVRQWEFSLIALAIPECHVLMGIR